MKNTNEFRDLETAEAHFYIPGPTEHCAFVKYKVLDLRACCNQPPCSPLHIDRERYFVHWPSKEAPFSAEAETIAQRWRGEIDTVDAVDIALRMCAREAFAAGRRIATSAIEQGLKNLGIDPSCGACAETFYSGSTIHMHTHPDDDKGGVSA